jgi:hypothetical protein
LRGRLLNSDRLSIAGSLLMAADDEPGTQGAIRAAAASAVVVNRANRRLLESWADVVLAGRPAFLERRRACRTGDVRPCDLSGLIRPGPHAHR